MRRFRTSRVVPWLLLAVVALIVYGSLYPFNFQQSEVSAGGLFEAIRSLSWARAGRGDRVSNLLLYVPFGFSAFLLLEARTSQARAGLLAVVAGTLLSLVIEVAQFFASPRVPSLMDLSLNAAGTLAGTIAGVAWRSLGGFVYVPAGVRRSGGAAVAVVVAWMALRLAPFRLEVDLAKLKSALAPLVHPHLDLLAAAGFLIAWLVVAQALFAVAGRDRGLDTLLGLIATVLVASLLIATQAFVPAELLALVLLLPGLVLLNGMRQEPRTALLAGAVALVLAWHELAPLEFTAVPTTFDFWPFLGWIAAGFPLDLHWLLTRVFLYAALLWLLRELGFGPVAAVGGLVAAVSGLELATMWQSDGTPSLTRPVLATLLGAGVHALDRARRLS